MAGSGASLPPPAAARLLTLIVVVAFVVVPGASSSSSFASPPPRSRLSASSVRRRGCGIDGRRSRSSSTTTTTTSLSKSSTSSQSPPDVPEGEWEGGEDCRTLPRLYVAGRRLSRGVALPLSSGQAHHLVNVVRLFKKRRRRRRRRRNAGGRSNEDDDDGDDDDGVGDDDGGGNVRIFNGNDGEWLARVRRASSTGGDGGGIGATSAGLKNDDGRRIAPSRKRGGGGGGGGADDVTSLVAECIVRLREQDRPSDDARPWVIFAPLKKHHRTKVMIEKCTEIGAGRMMPIVSDRTEGGEASIASVGAGGGGGGGRRRARDDGRYCYGDDDDDDDVYGGGGGGGGAMMRLDKLVLQSIEASEQCERLDVPRITRDAALARDADGRSSSSSSHDRLWTVRDFLPKWCSDWEEGGNDDVGDSNARRRRALLICRERGGYGPDGAAVPVLRALRENDRVAFLIGPEGGWSVEEEGMFDEVCSVYDGRGGDSPVRCVSLGSTILRAETACMVAVAAWALMNDSR